MKKLFTFLASITLSVMLFAQAPQSFSYQTVIRDASWTVLDNQSVGIKISILDDAANGTVVYEESHNATTSQIGLINLAVGDGTVMSGTFNTIDWGNYIYFIEVSVDVTGGSNYQVMGTTQLRSVPYALYAKTSGSPGATVFTFNSIEPTGIQAPTNIASGYYSIAMGRVVKSEWHEEKEMKKRGFIKESELNRKHKGKYDGNNYADHMINLAEIREEEIHRLMNIYQNNVANGMSEEEACMLAFSAEDIMSGKLEELFKHG